MTLDEARDNIGKGVVYTRHGDREEGVITRVSHRFAFVRYRGDQHVKATDPVYLTLLAAPRKTDQ